MSTTLWTSEQAAAATKGRSTQVWQASGVSIDTRSLEPGDLFVAIAGPNHDAHDFVAEALRRGAAAAVVSRRPEGLEESAPLLTVEDTLRALEDLGRAARARSKARFVGVTGSAGKTGTKEALGQVLSRQGRTHWSVGSFNNHWGVPLTLARLPLDAEFAVIELGMNHAGELSRLTAMARPHVAVITTIAAAHMAYFKDLDAIAEAKAEIFEGLPRGLDGSRSGAAVINCDIPQYGLLARRAAPARVLPFGRCEEAFARLLSAEVGPESSEIEAEIGGERLRYRLSQAGEHWVMNSLGVLAAVWALGGSLTQAAESLGSLPGLKGRGARHCLILSPQGNHRGGEALLIDESYNANPTAMRAALAVLSRAPLGPGGRRIAVLGDMLELGENAGAVHRDLAPALLEAGVERLYACGPEMKGLFEALPEARRGAWAADSQQLAERLLPELAAGDCILVKGSAGLRMGRVVEALLASNPPLARAANGV